jgi:hypothetical protein
MLRRLIKHTQSFEERLESYAVRLREQARLMPPGKERDLLLRKARLNQTTAHLNEWLTSPGLQPPK